MGHFALTWVWDYKEAYKDNSGFVQYSWPVYDDFEGRYQLAREYTESRKHVAFHPYYMWRSLPFKSQYVNVDANGNRITPRVEPVSTHAKKVFVLGGSTVFGEGSPDNGTIPAHLQAILGTEYEVLNMGEVAYTSTQELNYLLEYLSNGERPDIVIFYDGVNDGQVSVYHPAEPRGVYSIEKTLGFKTHRLTMSEVFQAMVERSGYAHLGKIGQKIREKMSPDPSGGKPQDGEWDREIAPKIATNVDATLQHYDEVIRQVKGLETAYGFKSYFFWQPNLFSDTRKPVAYEQEIVDKQSQPTWIRSQQALYTAARPRFSNREDERVYFLGDIFNTHPNPVFIDWCHITPDANRIIAQEMAEMILQQPESKTALTSDKLASI